MNTEIKERKMTQRQQRVPLGELARPEELESTKNDHEKTTAKIMQKMVKELKFQLIKNSNQTQAG